MERKCYRCKQVKPLEDFHRDRSDALGRTHRCKVCDKELNKRYRTNNPQFVTRKRERDRERFESLRREALEAYGNICTCCGSTEDAQIDHINPKLDSKSRNNIIFLSRIKAEGYPKDKYQLLCIPCHESKGVSDRCHVDHNSGSSS